MPATTLEGVPPLVLTAWFLSPPGGLGGGSSEDTGFLRGGIGAHPCSFYLGPVVHTLAHMDANTRGRGEGGEVGTSLVLDPGPGTHLGRTKGSDLTSHPDCGDGGRQGGGRPWREILSWGEMYFLTLM